MECYIENGVAKVQVQNFLALFRERDGIRELIACGPRTSESRAALGARVNEAGYWFLADNGTFSVNNPKTAEAICTIANSYK
jgi:hypothetical protein